MRFPKAVAASTIVALGCSIVVDAGVAAAADPGPTSFGILLLADAPIPAAGSRVSFTGRLSSGAAPVVGRAAQLWVRPAGQDQFVLAATATTDAYGGVNARVALDHNALVHWVFSGDAEYAASRTTDLRQRVATRVGARLDDSTLSVRQRLVVRGTTFPAKPGHTVSLWSGNAPVVYGPYQDPPTRLAVATVRADGSYRLVTRFGRVGHRKLFVRVSGGDGNTRGFSRYRYVEVG